MIFASSSADHFDCFFAGDSWLMAPLLSAGRFAGIALEVDVVVSARDDVECAATLAESDRASDRGRGEGGSLVLESSSLPLSNREISTVEVWCQDWPQGCEFNGKLARCMARLITGKQRPDDRESTIYKERSLLDKGDKSARVKQG